MDGLVDGSADIGLTWMSRPSVHSARNLFLETRMNWTNGISCPE